MPEYLVLLLVQVTIFSSVTAVLLLAVRWIFRRRIPPMLSMVLWLILFIRVTLPMLPESSLSIYNLIPAGRAITYSLTYDYEHPADKTTTENAENPYRFRSETAGQDTASAEPQTAADSVSSTEVSLQYQKNTERKNCITALTVVAAGMMLTGMIQYILYDRAIHRVYRSSYVCEDPRLLQIYTETAAGLSIMDKKAPPLRLGSTTMLAGLARPCVILCPDPDGKEIPESELRMIFLHELNHFKHFDNWILLMSTVVCTIFWFNPLLWLVRSMFREDIEVLCDARTLESCGDRNGTSAGIYARMLYRSSRMPETEPDAGVAMSASGRMLKHRLLQISNRRKGAFLPRTVSFVLCLCMIAICLTNPAVSAESAYAPYIESIAPMTGESVREFTLDEQVTVGEFLRRFDSVLTSVGEEALGRKTGSGSLELLTDLAAGSPYVSDVIAGALEDLVQEDLLTVENCSILLTALTGILGEGRYTGRSLMLPEMLSADTMESLCRSLTREEAEILQSCYNIGVNGAQVTFSRVYTEAMMKLILSRIRNNWSREKLGVYYQKVNLSAENLDEINAYLAGTVRYVGIGRDFYICDPALSRYEEENLRKILGAAYAEERDDVYYLKKTEDDCSFGKAAAILENLGMTWRDVYDEYALLGETAYEYTPTEQFIMEDGTLWIPALQLEEYLNLLDDEALAEQFYANFIYHETFTYNDSEGSEASVSMRYYVADRGRADICRSLMEALTERLNAVSFTKQYEADSVQIYDALSPAAGEACLLAANMGYLYFGSRPVSVQHQITSGQCAQVLCRFLSSMDNAWKN